MMEREVKNPGSRIVATVASPRIDKRVRLSAVFGPTLSRVGKGTTHLGFAASVEKAHFLSILRFSGFALIQISQMFRLHERVRSLVVLGLQWGMGAVRSRDIYRLRPRRTTTISSDSTSPIDLYILQ